MPGRGRYPGIMGRKPTAQEAIGLTELARQLRASAAQTNDQNYVSLFLTAAMALEARALAAPSQNMQRKRHADRH